MKRWCFPFASALAALLLLAGTVGCAESGETYAAFAPEESDRLVVYTSHKPEVYGPIVEEFESRTGIWVAVETGGTNELLARIEKEAEAARAASRRFPFGGSGPKARRRARGWGGYYLEMI